ncbi:MAG: hypothetical protein ACKVS8_14105 [Phycisphaerales bacterium]
MTTLLLAASLTLCSLHEPAAGTAGPSGGADVPPALPSYLAHIGAADASLRLHDTGAARRWLDAAPPEHRGWEWRYLSALTDQSAGVLATTEGTIHDVALSPDGAWLVLVTVKGEAKIIAATDGREIAALTGHEGALYRAAVSSDGSRLAVGGADKTPRIYEPATGKLIAACKGHEGTISGVAFSPDGATLASSAYHRKPDGSPGNTVIKLWDAGTGAERSTIQGGPKPYTGFTFSPDGAILYAGSWDGYVERYRVADGSALDRLTIPQGSRYTAINALAVNADGTRIAVGSKDHTARVWDTTSGALLFTLPHDGWVTGVAFLPDGRLATVAHDSALRLWDLSAKSELPEPTSVLHGHTAGPNALAVSADGSLAVSGGIDRAVRSWTLSNPDLASLHRRDSAGCYTSSFFPGGERLLTCAHNGSVSIWNARTGDLTKRWTAHEGHSANSVARSADGKRILTASWDKTLKLWTDTGEHLATFEHEKGVYHGALSPDGLLAAAAPTDKTIVLWDTQTKSKLHTLTGHTKGVQMLAFSPDSRLVASAGADGFLRVWDARAGTQVAAFTADAGALNCCAFTPDGTHIAAGDSAGTITLWRVDGAGGDKRWSRRVSESGIYRLAFSPDGTRLAAASQACPLIDAATGTLITTLRPPCDTLFHLDFSPDGSRLAVASTDGTFAILETTPASARTRGTPSR